MHLNNPLAFLRLVRLSGEDGEQWVREFESRVSVVDLCRRSVEVLRRPGQAREGAAMLERVRRELSCAGTDPSLRAALDRWYYAALGYYFYTLESFDEADGSMAFAADCVARAIQERRCLTVMAMACHEFRLHQARIARKRGDWRAMRLHAESGTAMRAGRQPFCTLADGTPIALADIERYYRDIAASTDEDRATLAHFTDERRAGLEAEFSLRLMFRTPGFAIQYP